MPFDERTEALASGRRQVLNAAGIGSPVVWLHGLGGVEPNDPLLAALAREHRVIAPLPPGFRDLEELEGLATFHDLALHYDDLLEALRLESVTLVGHSFGAMTAAEVAAHFPRRVSALVLLSAL